VLFSDTCFNDTLSLLVRGDYADARVNSQHLDSVGWKGTYWTRSTPSRAGRRATIPTCRPPFPTTWSCGAECYCGQNEALNLTRSESFEHSRFDNQIRNIHGYRTDLYEERARQVVEGRVPIPGDEAGAGSHL